MTLHAGDVSPRLAYRWLRRQPRSSGDVYLRITWDGLWDEQRGTYDSLRADTHAALHTLDVVSKTLDFGPGLWSVRTRCWKGRERHEPWLPHYWPADRTLGREYATLLAALLRTAARDGHALRVEAQR